MGPPQEGGGTERAGAGDENALDGFERFGMGVPRKVQQVRVGYDKASKQVDVRVLKMLLWDAIQKAVVAGEEEEEERSTTMRQIRFQDIIGGLPRGSPAGRVEDLSVALCFICVLHLCNEHGLALDDGRFADRGQDLETLMISRVPRPVAVMV